MNKFLHTWDVVQYKTHFEKFSLDTAWIVVEEKLPEHSVQWGFVICNNRMAHWWDIEGATKLRISLSSEPSEFSYKCKKGKCLRDICIQDENTGKWHYYAAYMTLAKVIAKLQLNHEFWYLGVEILE